MKPALEAYLDSIKRQYPNLFRVEVSDLVNTMYSQASDNTNYCFTYLPGI